MLENRSPMQTMSLRADPEPEFLMHFNTRVISYGSKSDPTDVKAETATKRLEEKLDEFSSVPQDTRSALAALKMMGFEADLRLAKSFLDSPRFAALPRSAQITREAQVKLIEAEIEKLREESDAGRMEAARSKRERSASAETGASPPQKKRSR